MNSIISFTSDRNSSLILYSFQKAAISVELNKYNLYDFIHVLYKSCNYMIVVHQPAVMKKTFRNIYRIIQLRQSLVQPPAPSTAGFEVKLRCSRLHSVGFWKRPRSRKQTLCPTSSSAWQSSWWKNKNKSNLKFCFWDYLCHFHVAIMT